MEVDEQFREPTTESGPGIQVQYLLPRSHVSLPILSG
jgi:hypothetical protein